MPVAGEGQTAQGACASKDAVHAVPVTDAVAGDGLGPADARRCGDLRPRPLAEGALEVELYDPEGNLLEVRPILLKANQLVEVDFDLP